MPSVTDTPTSALPAIPDGWIPDDAVILGIARRKDDGRWDVVLPSYTIVAQGASPDEAFHQAGELLADYFQLCARDGLSFEECRRPISVRWALELGGAAVFASVVRRLPKVPRRRPSTRVLRVPATHAFC